MKASQKRGFFMTFASPIFQFDMNTANRIKHCVKTALPQGMKTALWMLKITIPVSFLVFLLDFGGILNLIAGWVAPFFKLIGLSGQSSIVLITSFLTNIYSVIAVMVTIGFGHREGIILAVMCLISHGLIVETAIQKKTGSKPARMVMIRILSSFLAAWLLNLILPAEPQSVTIAEISSGREFIPEIRHWLVNILETSLKIIVLVNLLLVLQKILNEFGLIRWILIPFRPLLKVLGLPSNTGFLWIVAYTLGLGYGGAIMINEAEEGRLSPEDADLLNHHIAISHSQLEDPLLFVAIGYPLFILIWPRILISTAAVWLRRLEIKLRH